MPRRSRFDQQALDYVVSAQNGLVTAAQLAEIGMPPSTAQRRLGNAWTRVLPGVHLAMRGELDAEQRLTAGLLYAAHPAMLTGQPALRLHGVLDGGVLLDQDVHILVPHRRQRQSHSFVILERTHTMPDLSMRAGFPVAPVSRAVVDASRRLSRDFPVRAIAAAAVQRNQTTVDEIATWLERAPRQGTGFLRAALEELRAGILSLPEGRLRNGLLDAGMDEPLWNPVLLLPNGEFLSQPDGYFKEGVALEVDSREYHFGIERWEATMRRHTRMTAQGLLVIHISPMRIGDDMNGIVVEVSAARDVARRSEPPRVIVRPRNP